VKAIYDKSGRLIGWVGPNGRLMNRNGGSAFWINQDGNVFDYGGRHAGWWEGDHWRGPDGGIVGWQSGATTLDVTPPLAELPPLPPFPMLELPRPAAELARAKPVRRPAWSAYAPLG
jgi:hypothetical protein